MEKLVYLLWRPSDRDADDFAGQLVGPVAAALTSAGARGVQVNVADSAVATAMLRLSTFDEAPAAVIGIWVERCADAARLPIEAVLASASSRLAGWLVTESVPLIPPAPPGPGRQAGLAQIALIRRPARLSPEDWLHIWQDQHTAVAIETQATFGYVQNAVVRAVTADAPAVDGIVEELFPIEALADPHAFYGSGGDGVELARNVTAMAESVRRFIDERDIDVIPTSRYELSSPFVGSAELFA